MEEAWTNIHGFLFKNEAKKLQELADGNIVLEIGCYRGRSSVAMAPFAAVLDCVDHFLGNQDDCLGVTDRDNTQAEFLKNINPWRHKVTLYIESFTEFISWTDPTAYDFIFYDASHSEYAMRLFTNWLTDYRYGGTLAVHDYGKPDEFPGTQKVMDKFKGGHPSTTVGSLLVLPSTTVALCTKGS